MFTKEDFIEIISALEKQNEFDLGYANLLSQVTSVSDVPTYDNSSLTNLLFSLLQRQFPAIDGECEIERYCYALNFGWVDGNRVITYEDLWYCLLTRKSIDVPLSSHQKEVAATVSDFYPISEYPEKHLPLTNDLIDESGQFPKKLDVLNSRNDVELIILSGPQRLNYLLDFKSSHNFLIDERIVITDVDNNLIAHAVIKNFQKKEIVEIIIIQKFLGFPPFKNLCVYRCQTPIANEEKK